MDKALRGLKLETSLKRYPVQIIFQVVFFPVEFQQKYLTLA